MAQVKNAPNQQAMLAQILQNNPNTAAISQMLHSGNSLEIIARQMAQACGADINDNISRLQGGM